MNNKQLTKDEEAQVGIGTMIVFIATILVAAVAAGVLIDTSQKLQDKSTRTGTEAINNVGTSFEILHVWGQVGTDDIDTIYIDVRLAAGASAVDTSQMVIHYADGDVLALYGAPDLNFFGTDAAGVFHVDTIVRDDDSSFESGGTFFGVMNKDDIIRFAIGGTGDNLDLGNEVEVDMDIDLSQGASTGVGFTTPGSYGTDTFFELY